MNSKPKPKSKKLPPIPFGQKPRKPLKRCRLKMRGTSDASVLRELIQSALRDVVIKRDGGCILRDYPDTGKCGGYRKDGKLILQAEHLNSRTHTISFADSRLAVCLCKRHHIYWKPQNSARYWEIVEEMIGPKRWELFQKVKADRMSYKVDMKMALIGLKQELKSPASLTEN
jgi:hypothetical protein